MTIETNTTPAFKNSIRGTYTTDPAHPDTFNPNFLDLLNNDEWLRQKYLESQQQIESILGSDPINLSDQLDALVQYGAQQVFTEREEQIPTATITSAVGGDDSIDLGDTSGIEVGQHYFINDAGNVQTVRVLEILSGTRITIDTLLTSTVANGSTLARITPGYYTTPPLEGMEQGAKIYAMGESLTAKGLSGSTWVTLYQMADGGWELPSGIDRVMITGDVSKFAAISELPISVTRSPENVAPAENQSGLTTTPTLEGAAYYPLYGVPQKKRKFQVIEQGGSFSAPLYEAEETPDVGSPDVPVLSHVIATALSTDSDYQWRYQDENVEGEKAPWSLPSNFTTADTYVDTPSITSPLDGATDVPEQPVIELSAFNVVNGTDTQASSSVRIKDSGGTVVWESTVTSSMDMITVDAGILQEGALDYTIEAKHTGDTYGSSAWSTPITVTTSASFVPDFESEIGAPYGGGYVAGKIVSDYDAQTYGLIVSDGSGDSVQVGDGTMNWRTAQTAVASTCGTPPMTMADGRANHNAILALNDLANFPAFKWVEDNCNAVSLNGHDDWYLPSRDELELIYRNMKPTTQDNNDGTRTTSGCGGDGATYGTNDNSLPTGAGYTLADPAQTSLTSFQTTNADALEDSYYWSSSEYDASFAWRQGFNNGNQYYYNKDNVYRVRAVRRVAL